MRSTCPLTQCVVAVLDHDGDHEALADTYVEALRSHRSVDRHAYAKLSHVADLASAR